MLKSGFSELDITPHLGSHMPGYFHRRLTQTVLDKLYVRAWVVDNGETVLAVAAVDCVGLSRLYVAMIKNRAYSLCGIPPENILIACSHTHTGGPVDEFGFHELKNVEYLEFVTKRVADVIALAWQDCRPSSLRFGRGRLDGFSFCRIYRMRGGGLKTNPGALNPNIIEPYREIDKSVFVAEITRGGKIDGIVVHFACHCDAVNSENSISADYPGILPQQLRARYGNDVTVIFLQGPCGNINHNDPLYPEVTDHPARYREIGAALADEVSAIMERMEPAESDELRSTQREISIPMRLPDEELLAWAKRIKAKTPFDPERLQQFDKEQVDLFFATQALQAHKQQLTAITTALQVLVVGGLVIFTSPGELFSEYGDELVRASPFRHTIVVTYANDYIGYIVAPECMTEGVYEYRQTNGRTLGKTAGEQMNRELILMGGDLKREMRNIVG